MLIQPIAANSDYYRQLLNKRAIREFSLQYYLANEEKLLETEFSEFENNFRISEQMIKDLISIGEELGAKYSEKDFQQSKLLLKGYIKAEIASIIWDEEGYYPIMNPVSNEIYNRALQLFDEASLLAEAYNK